MKLVKLDVNARKKFFENLTSTCFILGLIIPVIVGVIGGIFKSGLIVAGEFLVCGLLEIIACIFWVWGDWIATYTFGVNRYD